MLEAPPHSHDHRAPLFPLYCGRQPHRRHHRHGHPPPCRRPAAIGPRGPNSPHPRDPLHPPVLRNRFPAKEPDPRRRTAAGLAAGRTPVEPPLPPCRQRRQPLPVSGVRARATAPSPARLGQVGRKRARPRALAPTGPKSPPPSPASWKILSLFPFPFLFPIFTYIFRC